MMRPVRRVSNSTDETCDASRSTRKAKLANLLRPCVAGLRLVEHIEHGDYFVYRRDCREKVYRYRRRSSMAPSRNQRVRVLSLFF
jgi:hypothetical protein